LVAADSDIYRVQEVDNTLIPGSEGLGVYELWAVFHGEPDCGQVLKTPYWANSADVSKEKIGVHCADGKVCYANDAENVKILEMNFHAKEPNVFHWSMSTVSIYKDRGWKMYSLQGNISGSCYPDKGDTFTCANVGGVAIRKVDGVRMFRCKTSFTA
ncbi:hypothetical protein BU23DRAFT_442271, partial [Bimuria novae-zelandiae CBS 107.79]